MLYVLSKIVINIQTLHRSFSSASCDDLALSTEKESGSRTFMLDVSIGQRGSTDYLESIVFINELEAPASADFLSDGLTTSTCAVTARYLLKYYEGRLIPEVMLLRPAGGKIPSGGRTMENDDLCASGGALYFIRGGRCSGVAPAYLVRLMSTGPEFGICGNVTPL